MSRIDCLLIVPNYTSGEGSILKSFDYTMPPLGLLSIAAWLRQNNIKTDILDFTIEDTKHQSIQSILSEYCKTNGVPKWFGLSVCTPVAYNAYSISDICHDLFPDSKIVLGGPHITVLKNKVFTECISADYLISDEGEYTLCDLIKENDISSDNLFIRNAPENRVAKKAKTIKLEDLPMPAYDMLKFDKYVPPPASLNSKHPGIGIIASRGCPFRCSFCTKITGSNLRFYSIEQVVDQIKYLKEKFKIKQFHFYDDTITSRKSYITELCQTFLDQNLDIHWSAFARVDTVDEEILRLMKKAGCFVIMYGVESMDDNILQDIQKDITVTQIEKALALTRKVKIESRASVIIGNPTDTHETLEKTRKGLLKLKTDFLQVFIAIPMPGSKFYIEAKTENRIINENWEDYNLSKVLYKHPIFTEQELFKIQRKFYLSFYLRFSVLFRYISRINSFNAIKNILKGFAGFLKIVFAK